MAYKIDVTVIIVNHLKTIVNDSTGKPDIRDIFFFIILPYITCIALPYNDIFVNKDFISSTIGGLSIYVGLSLNLIVILFEIVQKGTNPTKKEFARDLIANTCFSVLLSIATIVASLFTVMDWKGHKQMVAHEVFYFLLFQMALIVLMLLKRLYYQLLEQVK